MKLKIFFIIGCLGFTLLNAAPSFSFCNACQEQLAYQPSCARDDCRSGWRPTYTDTCGNQYEVFKNIGDMDNTVGNHFCDSCY